jgi:hypothetical protein
LTAAGIGPGDEVLVPAYSWVSTATAALFVGESSSVGGLGTTAIVNAGTELSPIGRISRPFDFCVSAIRETSIDR